VNLPLSRLGSIRRGNELIVLLCGGDKSTQARDIDKAKKLSRQGTDEDTP
jgi:putative addiction module killer protein